MSSPSAPPGHDTRAGLDRPSIATLATIAFAGFAALIVLILTDGRRLPPRAPAVLRIAPAQVLRLPTGTRNELALRGEHEYAPGTFLTAEPDFDAADPGRREGFLLKVLHSTLTAGRTIVEVEPASLFEAVPNGELELGPGDYGELQRADLQQTGPELPQFAPVPIGAGSPDYSLVADRGLGETIKRIDLPQLRCDTSKTLTLSGKLARGFEPEFDLRWRGGASLRNPIREAKAILAGSLTAKLKAELTGAANCLIEQELARPSWHTVLWIHGVPVPVTFAIPLTASASASATGAVSASAEATVDGRVGVEYDGHVHGIHDFPKSVPTIVPTYAADAKLEATAGPDLELEAGWRVPALGKLAATAAIGVQSGVSVEYDALESMTKTCVPLDVAASIGVHLPLRRQVLFKPRILGTILECDPPEST
ncbi:MAG TPA: hypothetical protein VFW48_02305 [Solirubrobacterales bacterium]|nr:hypothetical protein [Solirubrobacterales bacterium]